MNSGTAATTCLFLVLALTIFGVLFYELSCWACLGMLSSHQTNLRFQPVPWNWNTPPLSVVPFRWYCFTFSWKGMCVVWTHTSAIVCCCVCVHAIPAQWFTFSEECVKSLVHIHFKPTIQAAKVTMLNIFSNSAITQTALKTMSAFLNMFLSLQLWVGFCGCVLACLEIFF